MIRHLLRTWLGIESTDRRLARLALRTDPCADLGAVPPAMGHGFVVVDGQGQRVMWMSSLGLDGPVGEDVDGWVADGLRRNMVNESIPVGWRRC